jgi:hypothetical protein
MRGQRVDLVGSIFTWLTVFARAPRGKSADSRWWCRCRCGVEIIVYGLALRAGTQKSCGKCGYREQLSAIINRTHGGTVGGRCRRYVSWMSAKGRVFNPNDAKYSSYGGRNITMCERWSNSYQAFSDDMGEMPDGYVLDRADNDGNYSCGKCPQCISNQWPMNCRWVTPKESANNRRPRGSAS